MAWSKTKQQLESFICPSLVGRVEYRATSYRYAHDKSGRCHITVDKKEVFNMCDSKYGIKWYQTVQEIKKEGQVLIPVSEEELEVVRKMKVPEEAVLKVARNRKMSDLAELIIKEQGILSKTDFLKEANTFLTSSIESSLESDHILPNIFALIDRRVGKKKLRMLKDEMGLKHPIVQYFYKLRCEADNI